MGIWRRRVALKQWLGARWRSFAVVAVAALWTGCVTAPAWATPQGGNVVSGVASIATQGGNTLIKQGTSKAIINWTSFSIGAGQSVVFQQPGSTSIALNRVLGGSVSTILGSLIANGQVWLITPNGVVFGKGAVINVGGLLATTSDITNPNFLSGNYNFGIPSANP